MSETETGSSDTTPALIGVAPCGCAVSALSLRGPRSAKATRDFYAGAAEDGLEVRRVTADEARGWQGFLNCPHGELTDVA